jgi:hypothetical protein
MRLRKTVSSEFCFWSVTCCQEAVGTARKTAIILSIGGTLWLTIGACSLVGLHLDWLEAAGFFVVGFSPLLAVYSGWLARACHQQPGNKPRLLWSSSIALHLSYLVIFWSSAHLNFNHLLANLWIGWLLLATALSFRGLVAERRSAEEHGHEHVPTLAGQPS